MTQPNSTFNACKTYSPIPAAQELVARRARGILGDRLSESIRPTTVTQALAVQAAVAELWCAEQDDSIGGWKSGLPTPAEGDQPEKLVLAPIFTRSIDSVGPVSLWPYVSRESGQTIARIEPELAFFLAKDLPARAEPYSPQEVAEAVGRVHMALELIGCRYAEPKQCTFPEMLADSLVNQGLFIGPEVGREIAFNSQENVFNSQEHAFNCSELVFNIVENGVSRSIKGVHPAGEPALPLYWLAEYLRSQGKGLVAGQAIITGSYAGVLEVGLNQSIEITYLSKDEKSSLGRMELEFRARLV